MLIIDCGAGTEVVVADVVFNPNPPVFPPLFVGMVTETAGLTAIGVVDDFNIVEVVVLVVGHKAATIPPFLTMPNSVLEFTVIDAHESTTFCATVFNAAMQPAEHPLLKSDFVHVGIWLSYVN